MSNVLILLVVRSSFSLGMTGLSVLSVFYYQYTTFIDLTSKFINGFNYRLKFTYKIPTCHSINFLEINTNNVIDRDTRRELLCHSGTIFKIYDLIKGYKENYRIKLPISTIESPANSCTVAASVIANKLKHINANSIFSIKTLFN